MKIIVIILSLLICYAGAAQTISVGTPDATQFPVIRAGVSLFDAVGNPVSGATAADFRVTEGGVQRPITLFDCPPTGAAVAISSVLVLDISRSMAFIGKNGSDGLSIAKTAARAWVDNIDLTISECAVTSFDNYGYLNQDFTADVSLLRSAVAGLSIGLGTDYTAALLTPPNGGIPVVSQGKYKRVIILLTDGQDPRAQSNQAAIIAAAQAANITVYCVAVRLRMPQTLKNIAEQTGGEWYENVDSPDEAAQIYRSILRSEQGSKPCTLEWRTEPSCDVSRTAIIEWIPQNRRDTVTYSVPPSQIAQISVVPSSVRLGGVPPGTSRDTAIILKTAAFPANIKRLFMSSADWSIVSGAVPPAITVPANDSVKITIRYTAQDSLRSFAELIIESDACNATPAVFTAGYPRKQPIVKTLTVVHPNGGEEFSVNSDTVIKWKGVLPDEEVVLKYSTDKGASWINIANSATGLSIPWHVPNTPSDNCLMSVAQYDAAAGMLITIPHDDAVIDLAFSPDGQRIYTLTRKGTVRQFAAQTGQLLMQYSPNNIKAFALSPNEIFLAFVNSAAQMQLWNPQSGLLARNNGNSGFSGKPTFAAKDSTLLVLFGGNTIFAATLTPTTFGITSVANIGAPVTSMQFTPSGTKFIGAGTSARIARIWNYMPATPSVATSATLPHTTSVFSAAISSDAKIAATVDQNGNVRLWDAVSAAERQILGIGYKTAAISENGSFVAAGGTKKSANGLVPATLWTLPDGQFYRNLYGHTDTINAITFSRDGRCAATAASDKSVIIWDLSQLLSEIQSDTSDNLWKIVAPTVIAHDVDMGRMQVGMNKDSVVTAYIENTGKTAVSVSDISISGLRASEFTILSGNAPFELQAGEKQAVEFSFTPAGTGKRTATVDIEIPSGIIVQSIVGEGIIVDLHAVRNVDFGKVFLGDKKDTLVRIVLENKGSTDLTISGISSDGPDKTQFAILDSEAGFTLPAGSTRAMNLRFAPTRIGRTSGRITFAYPEPGSPEISLLSGEGICEDGGPATVSVSVPSAEVNPGDTLTIPVSVKYPAGKLTSSNRKFSATINYDGTLLTPLADSLRPAVAKSKQTINIAGQQKSPDTLTVLKFIVTLGSSDTTTLDVQGFTWDLCSLSPLIVSRPVTIKTCAAGGKRLYFPAQTVAILAIEPNPVASGAATASRIKYATPEDGRISLSILEPTGRIIASIFDGFAQKGEYSATLPAENLSAGIYYIVLKTPTEQVVRRMIMMR
ncbi:hypothetical protein MASR2M18_19680 [Ignavibacteria bacterium]|nr:choice-of-anchor D domain-containing protein [Bacteroidota bacterium]MCZ2131621.1 choice-of-anchor D domain-containing protein [Bacteroidota bacterium]